MASAEPPAEVRPPLHFLAISCAFITIVALSLRLHLYLINLLFRPLVQSTAPIKSLDEPSACVVAGLCSPVIADPSLIRDDTLPSLPQEEMPLRSDAAGHSTPHRGPQTSPASSSLTPGDNVFCRNPESPYSTPPKANSSGELSFATSSASDEIFLGPQPLSFVHYRRRTLNIPTGGESPSPSGHSMESLIYRDNSPTKDFQTLNPVSEDIASIPSLPPISPPKASHEEQEQISQNPQTFYDSSFDETATSNQSLSKWRTEQLKKFKPARPVPGARERPLPTLHGPLSLPYARNPSGVDATVADQNNHMSHLFGLRPVESQDSTGARANRPRIVNEEVTSRTVPGSSNFHSIWSPSKPNTTFQNSSRPLLSTRDRDPVFGLRKEDPPFHSQADRERLPPASSMSTIGSHSHARDLNSGLRTALGMGLPETHIAPPVSFARTASSPNPVNTRDATLSSSSSPWPRSLSDQYPQQSLRPPAILKTLQIVDPESGMSYSVTVPLQSPFVVDGKGPGVTSGESIHKATTISYRSSKADASVNWRSKTVSKTEPNISTSVLNSDSAVDNLLPAPVAKPSVLAPLSPPISPVPKVPPPPSVVREQVSIDLLASKLGSLALAKPPIPTIPPGNIRNPAVKATGPVAPSPSEAPRKAFILTEATTNVVKGNSAKIHPVTAGKLKKAAPVNSNGSKGTLVKNKRPRRKGGVSEDGSRSCSSPASDASTTPKSQMPKAKPAISSGTHTAKKIRV